MRTTEQLAGGVEFPSSAEESKSHRGTVYNNLNIGVKKLLANGHLESRPSNKIKVEDGDLDQLSVSPGFGPASPPHLKANVASRLDGRHISESKIFTKLSPIQEVWSPSGTRQISSRKGATFFTSVKLQFLSRQGFDFGITPTASSGSWKRESLLQEQLNHELSEVSSHSGKVDSEADTTGLKPSGDLFLTGDLLHSKSGHQKISNIIPRARRSNTESAANLQQNEGAWLKVGRMTSHIASIRLEFNDEHAELIGESPLSINEMKTSRLRQLLQTIDAVQKGNISTDSDQGIDITDVSSIVLVEDAVMLNKMEAEIVTGAIYMDDESSGDISSDNNSDVTQMISQVFVEEAVTLNEVTTEAKQTDNESSDDSSSSIDVTQMISQVSVEEAVTLNEVTTEAKKMDNESGDDSSSSSDVTQVISTVSVEEAVMLNEVTTEAKQMDNESSGDSISGSGSDVTQMISQASVEEAVTSNQVVTEAKQMDDESSGDSIGGSSNSSSDVTQVTSGVLLEEAVMLNEVLTEAGVVQMDNESSGDSNSGSSSSSDVTQVISELFFEDAVTLNQAMTKAGAVQVDDESSGDSISGSSSSIDVTQVISTVSVEETVTLNQAMTEAGAVHMDDESSGDSISSSSSSSDVTQVISTVSVEEAVTLYQAMTEAGAVRIDNERSGDSISGSSSSSSSSDVTQVISTVSVEEAVTLNQAMTEAGAVQMDDESSGDSISSSSSSDVSRVIGTVSVEEAVTLNQVVTEAVHMDNESSGDSISGSGSSSGSSDVTQVISTVSVEEAVTLNQVVTEAVQMDNESSGDSISSSSSSSSDVTQVISTVSVEEAVTYDQVVTEAGAVRIDDESSGDSISSSSSSDVTQVISTVSVEEAVTYDQVVIEAGAVRIDDESSGDISIKSIINEQTTVMEKKFEFTQDISGTSDLIDYSSDVPRTENLSPSLLIPLASTTNDWDISMTRFIDADFKKTLDTSNSFAEYEVLRVLSTLSSHSQIPHLGFVIMNQTRETAVKSARQSPLKHRRLSRDILTGGRSTELVRFQGIVIDAEKEGFMALDRTVGYGRGEHTALLVILALTSCVMGYIFLILIRRTVASVRQWQRQRINLRISDLESRAVQLMTHGEYGKAITVLHAGLKYVISVDGKQLHVNSAGFKHLLGRALSAQGDYSAAEKAFRSLISYYEEIASNDLHLGKLLEDLGMSLLYQGQMQQEEAYEYLTRALKIFETEMMLALRSLGNEEGSFYGVSYHAQVYSARLIGDAIASVDADCAVEADATSLPKSEEYLPLCADKDDFDLDECERAVAELDALLAAPVAVEVCPVNIPHSMNSILRQVDVARVRFEMGLVLELSERYEDAIMVIEEAHEMLSELTAEFSGETEFVAEVNHINALSLVMLKKMVFLERFLAVKDDPHSLIPMGDDGLAGKIMDTPKRVQNAEKKCRDSPDTVIF